MYKVAIVVLQCCDCIYTAWRKTHKIYTQPSIQEATAGEYGWYYGGCLEIGTVLTQKCGDDLCAIGGNTASITADRILITSLKLKDRDWIKK